jgi:arsenite-transporting ATPase
MQPAEILGSGKLADFGASLWSEHDPFLNLSPGKPLEIRRCSESSAELTMELPNVDGTDVGLTQQGAEISVSVGPYRRNLMLPDSLRGFAVRSAAVSDGELRLGLERSTGSAGACGA